MTTTDKPDYLALLTRRAESGIRPVQRVKLCLDPERLIAYAEARQALAEAEKQHATQGDNPSRRYADAPPLEKARKAAEAAKKHAQDATLCIVIQGGTLAENAEAVKKLADDANADDINAANALAGFIRAETLDGEIIPEIDKAKFEMLLPTLTTGERTMLATARNAASSAPDFPM